jgi:hypothetical protein
MSDPHSPDTPREEAMMDVESTFKGLLGEALADKAAGRQTWGTRGTADCEALDRYAEEY